MAERKTIDEQEKEVLAFWDEDGTFGKSLEKTKDCKEFVFYDGPPFATGLPHYGHILASVLKDVFPRFWTMKGFHVRRVWGWDCHGLPIENIAEKELGINSKDEIEKMGVDKFNKFCRSKVLSYASEWEKIIKRLGRWVDFENSYKTMDTSYIESVWWVFSQMWKKGLVYEGEKILMYCPRCSTPLAKSEVAMGDSYQTKKDETITITFKLKDEDAYALAWTTTPWTLPSNLALCVNPEIVYSYVRDKQDGKVYVLAKELISKFFKSQEEYETLRELSGKELEGKKYEPLFPYFRDLKNSFRILVGDFVTAEDGTGIVHLAPAFGEDDYNVCKKNGIDFVSPVDERGRFTEEVKDFAGDYIFDSNKKIIEFLKKQGNVVKVEKKEHEYPFCYRCDTPLFYKAMPALFVNIEKLRKLLIESNQKVNWHPEFLKQGRVRHNLVTAPDWNISRNRFWAASIPLWKSKSGKIKVLESVEELKKYAISLPKGEIDLHKDFVDKIKLSVDGEEMERIPDVFDCWFESGSMPCAQFHYPFENEEIFKKMHPADFIAEGLDQTRGWFYTLAVIGNALFKKTPFRNVLVTGLILAEDGKKMSKRLNNYPSPEEIFEKYGVDAMRFYLLNSNVMNADNFNFSEKGVEEIYKKVLVLLYNVNNFYSLYPAISVGKKVGSDSVLDRWIVSRLNGLIRDVRNALENYDVISATNSIRVFIDELSTWYVRRSRDRFNEGDSEAKTTLNYVLDNLSRVCAPIMPFVSERIYKNLGKKKSVHLQSWPDFDEEKIDKELDEEMNLLREVVSLALKERDVAKVSLKQPLSKLEIVGVDFSENFVDLIKEEVNVKEIGFKKGKELSTKLDLKITPELEAEGFAREISRNVQACRKKLNLVKDDLIELFIETNANLSLEEHERFIKERVGAISVSFGKIGKKLDFAEEREIRGKKFKFGFRKV